MTDCLLVLCTCPDRGSANAIATALLEKRLAACVNRVSGVTSMYRWEGQINRDDEVLLLIKTTDGCYPELEKTIVMLHPYELPEIVGVPFSVGSDAYIDWIRNSTA